jgi:hypothetical protein
MHEREITIYAFSNSQLIYTNTFQSQVINDDQYYILNVWNQLGFDQLDDELLVVGDIRREGETSRCEEFAEKTKKFVKHVSTIHPEEDFQEKITKGNPLLPYDLQTLLVCGF